MVMHPLSGNNTEGVIMAFARQPKNTRAWQLTFRGLRVPLDKDRLGRFLRRRQRLNVQTVITAREAAALANRIEAEIDALDRNRRDGVGWLAEIGAISGEIAAELGGTQKPPATKAPTVREAFAANTSTIREKARSAREFNRHESDLEHWVRWAGSDLLSALTPPRVTRYVEDMRANGDAWDTRRHRIMVLRR
jgi:hypothetical protein